MLYACMVQCLYGFNRQCLAWIAACVYFKCRCNTFWLNRSQDPEVRPDAPAILKVLEDFFDARQDSNMHGCTNSDNCLDESDRGISDLDENADESQEQSTNISSSPHSSQPLLVPCTVTELEILKSKSKVVQYKSFQVAAIEALQDGKDVIVVQPTGSGKSLCYIASTLLNPGKITLVFEPMVVVITNQIQNLKAKGIDAFALGNAAGKKQSGEFLQSVQGPL